MSVVETDYRGTERRAVVTSTVLAVIVRALNSDDSGERARALEHVSALLEDTYRVCRALDMA